MAEFYRFLIGKASVASTPSNPIINAGDFYEFSINPDKWDAGYSGGAVIKTISGNAIVSTTQVPSNIVTLNWPKLTAEAKRKKCDYYFLINSKLILVDDQLYMYEAVVMPNSYKYARRKSTKTAAESYSVQVQMLLRSSGKVISESDREDIITEAGTGIYIGGDFIV